MQSRIPIAGVGNEAFKDVFDYLEEIQKRRSLSQSAAEKLAEEKRQFGMTNQLEQNKLAETEKYHQGTLAQNAGLKPLQMELLKAKILQAKSASNGKTLSPQERSEKMKLLTSARNLQGIYSKQIELKRLLEKNPTLTGWIPSLKNYFGKGGKQLGKFTSGAGELQALIARLGGQRGGAALVQWAKTIKPSEWKDIESNIGLIEGGMTTTEKDYDDIRNEFKYLTDEDLPMSLPKQQEKMVEIEDENGNKEKVTISEAIARGVEGV
jgi:hypothetical protein